METEADTLRREIQHLAALQAVLARHAPDADDFADLLRENIEMRRGWLAQRARLDRMH